MHYSEKDLTALEVTDVDRSRGIVNIWDLMRGWKRPVEDTDEAIGRIYEFNDGKITYEAWGKVSASIEGRSVEQVLARLNYAVSKQFT